MAKVRDPQLQKQIDRDIRAFRETGKATDLAKVYLRFDAMDAIWDIAEGRGRKKWGQF